MGSLTTQSMDDWFRGPPKFQPRPSLATRGGVPHAAARQTATSRGAIEASGQRAAQRGRGRRVLWQAPAGSSARPIAARCNGVTGRCLQSRPSIVPGQMPGGNQRRPLAAGNRQTALGRAPLGRAPHSSIRISRCRPKTAEKPVRPPNRQPLRPAEPQTGSPVDPQARRPATPKHGRPPGPQQPATGLAAARQRMRPHAREVGSV